MEYPRSPSLNWTYYYQGKSMEELRHALFCSNLELETTKLTAQEEIKKREHQVNHLKELLNRTIWERDEAEEKCQRHLMDKLLLFQQLQQQGQTHQNSGVSSIDDETRISSSDCEESIVSSPISSIAHLIPEKPLPEKGKLLQAVMKAGPLLQTLLLAGPLPQWRHPPPPLEPFEIPPVAIPPPPLVLSNSHNNVINKKRIHEGSDSTSHSKHQRVLLP
ncbi:hypothetical protein ACHQM5_020540 [Ranunculus cassubicifolius]